ncbi:MAG: sulfatase-like hydrolase/transferase [Bacteroides sp.]|nr:sulfatase-like hydrolase/transferase [Bacteroides sp.]
MKHLLFSLPVLCTGSSFMHASHPEHRMNIVLILADDLGYECVGANGSDYVTPNLDKLAREGMRFEHCHSNPLSTPSRVQLMTGKYNVRNYTAFARLDRQEITFANLLKESGYATCVAGKWQLGAEKDSPMHFGFDSSCLWQHTQKAVDLERWDTRYAHPIADINGETVYFSREAFSPDIYCDFILDFIRENKAGPFFVYYPMALTHSPFVSTPDSKEWSPVRSATYRGDPMHFPDMVKYTDKLVGRIMDELERSNVKENTLVIFTGDNGTATSIVSSLHGKPYVGGKGKTSDSGTHVPLIVYYPDGEPGKVNSNLIDFTDFLPTLCEVAKVDTQSLSGLDGISFYPQLTGKNTPVREWIYCWYAPQQVDPEKATVFARTHQYKLYRSGEFYDVCSDFDEQYPIVPKSMTQEQKEAYDTLSAVIDQYEAYAIRK